MSVNFDASLYYDKGSTFKVYTALDVQRFASSTRTQKPLRAIDLSKQEIVASSSLSASKRPAERLLHLETDTGYFIECTPDTEIYTLENGFVPAELLQVNDKLLVNGDPCNMYQDRAWLEEQYVKRKKTQAEIAEMCSTPSNHVSPRTIRAWVKKFDLGRGDSGAQYGEDNPNYRGDDVSHKGLYDRSRFLKKKPECCEICGRRTDEIDFHHLDHNLYNSSEDNIVAICPGCHAMCHHGATVKHTRPAFLTVKRIAGVDQTISISTEIGNYVAGGFIIRGDAI